MASVLYQSIEALSRDKGIDPQIVVSAVEDAIALATRKYYKTQENMRAELDRESGEIRAYVYKTVVEAPEQLEDPVRLFLPAAEVLDGERLADDRAHAHPRVKRGVRVLEHQLQVTSLAAQLGAAQPGHVHVPERDRP